jgi:hypothetical protein
MRAKRTYRRTLPAAFLASLLLSSCALIVGVEDVSPRGEGGAASSSTESSSTHGASNSGGGTGAGGSGPDLCEPACADFDTCCGDACVNTATDTENCNTCGTTCDTGAFEICQTGGASKPTCADVEWALWPVPDSTAAFHPPTYRDNGDGTVTDHVTGLTWQKVVNDRPMSWANAKEYCSITLANRGLGGHHDWRLPSRIELGSLVDYLVDPPGPTIDAGDFPDTPAEFFWTATPNAPFPTNAWVVDFASGLVQTERIASPHRVRCVR